MLYLVLGIGLFFGTHLLPTYPRLRARVAGWLGENLYKGGFALLSLIGLNLIGMGMVRRSMIIVWEPPPGMNHLAMVVMLPMFILIAAAYLPSNVKRFLRHPMLMGVILWALGHLLSNGDLGAIILFGAFLLYSLYDIRSANRRGARPAQEAVPRHRDFAVVALGLAGYVLFVFLHPYIIGVAVLG